MPTYPLKDMPDDVKDHVLDVQLEIKKKKKISQFSKEATIYHIIREHKKMSQKK